MHKDWTDSGITSENKFWFRSIQNWLTVKATELNWSFKEWTFVYRWTWKCGWYKKNVLRNGRKKLFNETIHHCTLRIRYVGWDGELQYQLDSDTYFRIETDWNTSLHGVRTFQSTKKDWHFV